MRPLRIALLCASDAEMILAPAKILSGRGHALHWVQAPSIGLVDRQLDRRGYEPGTGRAPFSYLSLRLGGADLAHAFSPAEGAVVARWSRRGGGPSVFSLASVPSRQWLVERRRRLESVRAALSGCAITVAPSRHAADALIKSLGTTPEVIHPGVELTGLAVAAERSPAPTIACPVGAMDGIGLEDGLAEAMRTVRRTLPDAELVPGTGDRELARAWITLLAPDPQCAFSTTAVRALACGTPVVCAAQGAGAEIVADTGVGAVFAQPSPEALAAALLEALSLAQDPATPERCRTQAERFSPEFCAIAYESLYAELCP